jgi:D-glucosaminate-specific PTS system IIB component
MAKIVLCRVDSRLIHGQVVTKWVNQAKANRIVVVSDELDADPFMKSIYMMSAPPNVKVDCYSLKGAVDAWKENAFGRGNILLLFPGLVSVHEAINSGIGIEEIQVGGLGGGPKRKVVFQNITLDEKDAEILKELSNKNIKIFFQTIPEDRPQSLTDILKKYNS